MNKPLRTLIGLLLLLTTVSLASCQALFKSLHLENILTANHTLNQSESKNTRFL